MPDAEEKQLYELSNLDVEAVGLVWRGANRSPFYFVKSDTGGKETMADEIKEPTAAEATEDMSDKDKEPGWLGKLVSAITKAAQPSQVPQEPAEEFALSATEKEEVGAFLRKFGKGKLGAQAYSILEGMIGGGEGKGYGSPPEKSSDTSAEDFAEAISKAKQEVVEEFAQKLQAEETARKKVEEAFADEQRKRRLHEFTDTAQKEFSALATGDLEAFATDLLEIHDADEKRYDRLVKVLKAAQEGLAQGALFQQFSSARPTAGGDPFEAAVEQIRVEKFGEEQYEIGWTHAFDAATRSHPDLARSYAQTH